MTQQADRAGRIVVGVDGSPSSKAALVWAVRQAELTGDVVEAVIAWHYPTMAGGYVWAPITAAAPTSFEEISANTLTDAIRDAVGRQSKVRIDTTVREGNPAQVLVNAAKGADLLVVGSRGHGGFTGALLGSVSQHCAHHAQCPLVIIRSTVSE